MYCVLSQVVGGGPITYIHIVQGGCSPKTSPTKVNDKPRLESGTLSPGQKVLLPPAAVHRGQKPPESGAQQVLPGKLGGNNLNAESVGKLALEMDLYKDMPELVNDVGVADSSDTESTCSSSNSWLDDGDDAKRMINETRRLLLAHQEHAMTLAELVEDFGLQEDPSNISVQGLFQYLNNDAATKKFKVLFFFFKVNCCVR